MSLKKLLHKRIQTQGRLSYGDMCQFAVELGYKVNTAERELRHLMAEEKVHAERSKSKRNTEYISAYLANKPKQEQIIIKEVNGRMTAVRV